MLEMNYDISEIKGAEYNPRFISEKSKEELKESFDEWVKKVKNKTFDNMCSGEKGNYTQLAYIALTNVAEEIGEFPKELVEVDKIVDRVVEMMKEEE